MTIEKILVIDDEPLVCSFLQEALSRKNMEVTTIDSGLKALALMKENAYDLIITDMRMPDLTGIDILRKAKEITPGSIVIVITAFGSIENAVEAMRLGAFNYIIKPFSPDTIEALIDKANQHASLVAENTYLRETISTGSGGGAPKIIGNSPAIQQILADVERIAKTNATVFITGESGTGKEVIAHAIHYHSLRAGGPFIKVNCAAVPDTLIESEFFGHEKGSFTGANVRRQGRFELASGGTLLLDEVTEIPLGLQAKLLRAIQEQEFERVGGTKPVKVDVRLISTSNRNMKEAIAEKVLREDLYYRLNVVPIHLPALRERKEDIIPLADFFLEKMCIDNHKEPKKLSEDSKKKLLNYAWPGNVRELANVIERAVVMSKTQEIKADELYIETEPFTSDADAVHPVGPDITLKEIEKRHILAILENCEHNKTKAAEALGISVKTLRNKLQEYQLL